MRVYTPGATLRGTPGLTANVTMPGVVAGEENLTVSNDTPPYAKSEGFGQSLKVEYELPKDFTLVSITSHDQFRLDDQLDSDRTSYAGIKNSQGGYFKAKANTQEVRLLSPGDGPFRYTLGLFYGDNDLRRSFKRGPGVLAGPVVRHGHLGEQGGVRPGRMDLPAQDHGHRRPALPEGRHRLLFQRHPERQRQVLGRRRRTSQRPIAWACATRSPTT
jgi:hypothetical protein